MDFLDPKKRRAHHVRVMIGYLLMAIIVAIGTTILVYEAYGYGVDTDSGGVVQNGLVFVNSQPGGADIYLNGKLQKNRTDARMVLPGGRYTVGLKKSGYHDWQRTFQLEERSIERLVYPLLVPNELVSKTLHTYAEAAPGLTTQSPDRRWLMVQSSSTATSFDVYDTSKTDYPRQVITLPADLLTEGTKVGSSLKEVEWSTDNRHVLLEHTYASGREFVVIDHEDVTKSYNINKLFTIAPDQVALRDKKFDLLYLHTADQLLRTANAKDHTLSTPILTKVLAFEPYGEDLLSYMTAEGAPAGKIQARIWEKGNTYALQELSAGSVYSLQIAKYEGDWYYVVGSDTDERIIIYKNPLDNINGLLKQAVPLMALRQKGTQKVSFSSTARFVAAFAGQQVAVYDAEEGHDYHYTAPLPIDGQLKWMDGHRLTGLNGGQVAIFDYDGINQALLGPSTIAQGGLFDRDYIELFTITPSDKGSLLKRTNLRNSDDLPAALR